MIESDDGLAQNEDCRYEHVMKQGASTEGGEQSPNPNIYDNLVIIFNRGDKFFCITETKLKPSEFEDKEPDTIAAKDEGTEGGNQNEEHPEQTEGDPSEIAKIPVFDMFAARKRYRTELTEAEKEIPSFDVTRHERCLTCGTLGVDRFVCKSELKIWTGDITKREKIGLVFLKHKDEAGKFVGNT